MIGARARLALTATADISNDGEVEKQADHVPGFPEKSSKTKVDAEDKSNLKDHQTNCVP